MASMTILFAAVLVAAVVAPVAQAQLSGLLGLVNITGIVPCSIGSPTTTGNVLGFPNAAVQLQCGGNVISSTTTNSAGAFTMLLNPLVTLLTSLLTDCKLVVQTPLATCNASLPAIGGILQSPLQLLTGSLSGILGILNLVPAGFALVHG